MWNILHELSSESLLLKKKMLFENPPQKRTYSFEYCEFLTWIVLYAKISRIFTLKNLQTFFFILPFLIF